MFRQDDKTQSQRSGIPLALLSETTGPDTAQCDVPGLGHWVRQLSGTT